LEALVFQPFVQRSCPFTAVFEKLRNKALCVMAASVMDDTIVRMELKLLQIFNVHEKNEVIVAMVIFSLIRGSGRFVIDEFSRMTVQ
jgi:hypothetical protein